MAELKEQVERLETRLDTLEHAIDERLSYMEQLATMEVRLDRKADTTLVRWLIFGLSA
jgi:chaperonin cofactor prefoldin